MDDKSLKIAELKDEIAVNVVALLKLVSELYKANGNSRWSFESPSTREHIRVDYTPF